MQYILIRGLVKNFEYIPVVSNTWSSRPTEALDDEAAKKPPGEAILTALTDADMEALDSILDSNALPGSAFIEVALEPVLDEGLWNVKDFLQAPTIPILSSGDTSSSWWCLKKGQKIKLMGFFFFVKSKYILKLSTTQSNILSLYKYLRVLSLKVSSMILLESEEFCNSGLKLICGLIPPSSSTCPLISVKVPPGVLLVCEGETYLAALTPARLGESDAPG